MNQTFFIMFVAISLVTLLAHTEAAVVGHHPDPARKSLQRKNDSVQKPSFLLFRRATEAQDDKTDSSSLIQEPQNEDNESISFMMISSTFTADDGSSGSDPFGERDDSPGVVSIDMTIIQFSEPPSSENRRVPRRFGSRGPLTIERSSTSDSNDESPSSQTNKDTSAGQAAPLPGSGAFQDSWKTVGEKSNQIPWTVPTGGSRTHQAQQPQDSYQNPSPRAKAEIPHPFAKPVKEQVVLSTSPTFDNTSHHSQL